MFPFLRDTSRLASDYSGTRVVNASVNQARKTMELVLNMEAPAPQFELNQIKEIISNEFGLKAVNIVTNYPHTPAKNSSPQAYDTTPEISDNPPQAPSKTPQSNTRQNTPLPLPNKTKANNAIMGRNIKTKPTPISEITIDLGKTTVKGEVCAVRSRAIEKSKSWLIDFDITDYTGTINVSRYTRDEKASKIVDAVKEGMFLLVSGTLGFSKYDNELKLDPANIVPYEHTPRVDTAKEKRVELHLHTKMSAMDALTDVEDVIKKAIEWGHPAIAITDHGIVHSFPAASKVAHKTGNKIKIIYGIEGYFRNEDKSRKRRNNHITLLVKNQAGLKNLYKLVTKSHLEHYDGRPIIYKTQLEEHRDGLLVGTACEAGEVYRAIVNNTEPDELDKIAEFYDYLEIMPVCNNNFMLLSEIPKAKNEDELREFNKKVTELGSRLNKPVVATGDVHFLEPEHETFRHILQTSKGYSDAGGELPLYFKTTDEMLEEFNYLGEEPAYEVVIKNTQKIADMCEVINPLPPEGKLFQPKLEGSAAELEAIIRHKIPELYGENPHDIILKRMEYELHDIIGRDYDIIYMAAQKIVAYLKERKSRVGSRGSVGSSFVAYLAGITEVNPLPAHYRCPNCKNVEFPSSPTINRYACGPDMPDKPCTACGCAYIKDGFNIPFETFMGFDGEKVPDIDLNISSEHQAEAHKFTSDMFGADHVFRAGTIGTVKDKTSYKFAKKYLDAVGKTVGKAEESRLARGCLGIKQTTGQHPGGLIVIPQDKSVTDFCPAQHPADDSDKGVTILHFEYEYLEDNLIKLDILGHDNPTMLKMLEDMSGLNADDLRLDDPTTMAIFSSPTPLGLPKNDPIIGETGSIGIPEFGTPFTRQMLKDTKPESFDTLIRLSGYSHGENVWLGNSKDLIASGKVTIEETISSRDDIMLFLMSKGMADRVAFKISESVRKGYGIPNGLEKEMKDCKIPPWYIESCKKISYLFPKAHAVAYVMMAFRIAWFKVHKPLEFYSAHFYRRRKSFDLDFMTRGIDVIRSKINQLLSDTDQKSAKDESLLTTLESCYEFYMRGFEFTNIDLYDSDAEKFLIVGDNTLRPPFIVIGGLGETAAHDLVAQRNSREFVSIDDISTACPSVNKNHLDQLNRLGALRDLPTSSQMSLF
jgi:DNA polymerase-3 subunit alpha (Gram-positive type)